MTCSPAYSPLAVNKHDIRFLLDAHAPQPPAPSLARALPVAAPAPALRCKHCAYTAPARDQLLAHARAAHKIKPFACQVCDKTFAERGNANKHYRVAHLKQRNHRCQTCDRCFAFRDGLNRHISMVHLNQRPFECNECMCPKGPHPRSIACTHICGMRFKQKSHRRRHVHSVHQAAGRRSVSQQAPAFFANNASRVVAIPNQWTRQLSLCNQLVNSPRQ